MKKLIIVKNVGLDTKIDNKILRIVKMNRKNEVTIYCNVFKMTEIGEDLRSRGVNIYPISNSPYYKLNKDFDIVSEIDEWAKGKGENFLKETPVIETKKQSNNKKVKK